MVEVTTNSFVKLVDGATDYNGGMLPPHIQKLTWNIHSISDDRCVLGYARENPTLMINIPVHRKYLTLVD